MAGLTHLTPNSSQNYRSHSPYPKLISKLQVSLTLPQTHLKTAGFTHLTPNSSQNYRSHSPYSKLISKLQVSLTLHQTHLKTTIVTYTPSVLFKTTGLTIIYLNTCFKTIGLFVISQIHFKTRVLAHIPLQQPFLNLSS